MSGLYLHIPYCKQACHYCDFHFSTLKSHEGMFRAMAHEIELQKNYLVDPLQTIYFGGGTPSLLDKKELESLFASIHQNFTLTSTPEITLEANPDDLTSTKLAELRALGINRLSIGIQSFDDRQLLKLNRVHDSVTAINCLSEARKAGFSNISIDMMYALPELAEDEWKQNIEHALSFQPEHVSAYALTIEDKTAFGRWRKQGKFQMVDEETAARHFELLMEIMEHSGYEHYEISNFCKPGFYSQHNSNYWKQSHYLGIGPSSHSFNGVSRQFNSRNNARYIASLEQGIIPFEFEILSDSNKVNEYIMTTLRTQWGSDLQLLKHQLGDNLLERCKEYISMITGENLIILKDDHLFLTRKGKLLADEIAKDLMITN